MSVRPWLARRAAACVAAAAAATLVGSCGAPATEAAYREDASQAVQAASSQTRTVELAVQAWLADRMPRTSADVVVTAADGALGPVVSAFAGDDPPVAAADRLRDEVNTRLGNAGDAVAAARIAVRRGDRPAARKAVAEVRQTADQLDALSVRLR